MVKILGSSYVLTNGDLLVLAHRPSGRTFLFSVSDVFSRCLKGKRTEHDIN